ncbi:sensor histidine kinase [Fodinicola acaciae]|uniref:sensor histidine kinase n=1 Tax=Fodinicola acaciae TaxID=2681555 RepID=UPI001C9E68EF|nr:sensor histidine kinase [Fodinicola acaciae]
MNVWDAVRLSPWRLLRSSWPWRAAGYLAGGALVGVSTLLALAMFGGLGVLLTPFVIGLALLVCLCLAGLPVAAVERRRVALLGFAVPGDPHLPAAGTPLGWLRRRLTETATWRELAVAALTATAGWLFDICALAITLLPTFAALSGPLLVAFAPFDTSTGRALGGWIWLTPPVGVVGLLASAYVLPLAAGLRAYVTRKILPSGPDPVAALTRSRARLVDGFEAERRRIERDLHDGAQQRLLALSVRLGMIRVRLDREPVSGETVAAVDAAHRQAKQTIEELRALVQGIHPRVLTDRGLAAALVELAGQTPVDLDVAVTTRFSAAIESAAYFTVTEAVANAVKHSGADRIAVTGTYHKGLLTMEIRDDGGGGADPAGSGLQGLADRAEAVGGRLRVTSPPGGPTVVRLEIPA